jgi:hypothetical protein
VKLVLPAWTKPDCAIHRFGCKIFMARHLHGIIQRHEDSPDLDWIGWLGVTQINPFQEKKIRKIFEI